MKNKEFQIIITMTDLKICRYGRLRRMSDIKKNDITCIKSAALWSTLSFLIPAAVMAVIMLLNGIAPFGDGTLINSANALWFDSYSGMYGSIVSGEGVFYHLNVGFGSCFYPEFASGLFSPFMFISFFFGQRSLAAAYSVITIVRTGASGASAWYMLRKCTGLSGAMSFALSCGYSLCGFAAFAAYYPSVADGAVFFPLLVTGIYVYVQASRPLRLFIFGAFFFLTCSRLLLLGVIISFAIYAAFYIRKGSARQRVYKFAMFSATLLCSAATSAFLVVPEWAGAVYYKNGVFSEIRTNDILSDICFGGFGTSPFGGTGLCIAGLIIIGFASFMFNNKISVGEKISLACGAVILIFAHTVPPLARLFLGFGNTDGEWVTAGFMLSLIALYCAARNIEGSEGIDLYGIAFPAGIYALLAVVSLAVRGNDMFSVLAETGLAVFTCAFFVQIFLSGRAESIRVTAITAAALTVFGAIHCAGAVGGIKSGVTASGLRYVAESRIKAQEELEESYRKKNEEVPRFYRIRSTDGASESVDIRKNQVAGFTEFAERLGIMRNSEYGGADNFTEFTDVLFGIANTDYGYYTKEAAKSKICSPAYLIGNWDNDVPEGMNALELQNYLGRKWFGAKLFEDVEPVEHTTELSSKSERYKWTFGNETTVVDKYVFELPDKAHLYMLVTDMDYSYAVGSDSRSNWQKACAGGIFCVNETGKDNNITLYLSADISQGAPKPVFMAYRGNLDDVVKNECADYISYRGSTVRFLFDAKRAQLALTSIPYENGWDITINGEKVEPVELCGGLIALKMEKGINSVVMTYTPPYFKISMWISAVLLAAGLYLTFKVEHEAERRRKVRMAFRAVELNISRMTADELDDIPEENGESNPDSEIESISNSSEKTSEKNSEIAESEEKTDEKV